MPSLQRPDAPRGGSEALAMEYADRGVRPGALRFRPTVHSEGDHGFMARLVQIAREGACVLVQREMESGRSLVASITSFRRGSSGRHPPKGMGGLEQGAAETATGFRKKIGLGGPLTSPLRWKKNKLAREE